jgi:NTE family protein
VVLDSLFLDNLEPDFEMLARFNMLAQKTDALRYVHAQLVRPTRDAGELAKEHIDELPYNLRQLFKTAAIDPGELGGLLSYLLFSPGFLGAMLKLGEADALAQEAHIAEWLER